MPSINKPSPTPQFWRSLDELSETPEFTEFVANEFPNHSPELLEQKSRRHFLKTMGASVALAGMTGMTGCFRWPEQKIFPYTSRPEGRLPGEPVAYATSVEMGGVAYGLLTQVVDGRPIKLDGNPQHPTTRGKSNSLLQAMLLDLYDPARSKSVLHKGKKSSWNAAAKVLNAARDSGGAGLHVLCEPTTSGVVSELRGKLAALPGFAASQWHEYEPINWDNQRLGLFQAFGKPLRPHYDLSRANVLVAIDDDLLESHPNALVHANDFAKRRRPEAGTAMSRIYALESLFSVTGSTADVRLPACPTDVAIVLAKLADRLMKAGASLPSAAKAPIQKLAGLSVSKALFDPERKAREEQKVQAQRQGGDRVVDYREPLEAFLDGAQQDLLANRESGLLTAGRQQPPVVHALVAMLNNALGNVGSNRPLNYTDGVARIPQRDDLANLCGALDSGDVQTLLILGGNPVYNTPADLAFAEKLAKVKGATIHLSDHVDETSRAAEWHLPRAHALECWGEAQGWDGTLTVQQPLLRPLYGGKSIPEVLGMLVGDDRNGHAMAKGRVLAAANRSDSDDSFWQQCLHDGLVAKTQAAAIGVPSVQSSSAMAPLNEWASSAAPRVDGALELSLVADYKVYDGRFANNAWLQEQPDPMTKIAWDNAALISMADAKRLDIPGYYGMGDNKRPVVKVTVGGNSIEIPAFVMPGQAEGVVTIPLGYGRKLPWGEYGQERYAGATSYNAFSMAEDVGANGFALLTQAGLSGRFPTATLKATGDRLKLATTQNHYAPDSGLGSTSESRVEAFVREVPYAEFKKNPAESVASRGNHVPHKDSLWPERKYGDRPRGSYPVAGGSNRARVELQKRNSRYEWYDLTDEEGSSPTQVRAATSKEAIGAAKAKWPGFTLETTYEHKWGMTIDLSVCTGCSACVTACTAENNIGVVGKDEVAYGREMHWIRIDRYFQGDPENPKVAHQPMTCHHCENAPCEQVCPVGATMHSTEGLNDMVYNRCIGTRYCSNNCPYKVRRFNYFNNHRHVSAQEKLAYNPEVTVRHRGVMEKCTFCTQRISQAKIRAKNEDRPVRDGEVVTACAQACPTDAITFGDLNDRQSAVLAQQDLPRSYAVLEELNVKPRLEYLARVRNTQA